MRNKQGYELYDDDERVSPHVVKLVSKIYEKGIPITEEISILYDYFNGITNNWESDNDPLFVEVYEKYFYCDNLRYNVKCFVNSSIYNPEEIDGMYLNIINHIEKDKKILDMFNVKSYYACSNKHGFLMDTIRQLDYYLNTMRDNKILNLKKEIFKLIDRYSSTKMEYEVMRRSIFYLFCRVYNECEKIRICGKL